MYIYALAVTPLINLLHHHQPDVSQSWFADDATAAGQFFIDGSNFSLWAHSMVTMMPPKHTLLLSHNSKTKQNSYFRTLMLK